MENIKWKSFLQKPDFNKQILVKDATNYYSATVKLNSHEQTIIICDDSSEEIAYFNYKDCGWCFWEYIENLKS